MYIHVFYIHSTWKSFTIEVHVCSCFPRSAVVAIVHAWKAKPTREYSCCLQSSQSHAFKCIVLTSQNESFTGPVTLFVALIFVSGLNWYVDLSPNRLWYSFCGGMWSPYLHFPSLSFCTLIGPQQKWCWASIVMMFIVRTCTASPSFPRCIIPRPTWSFKVTKHAFKSQCYIYMYI